MLKLKLKSLLFVVKSSQPWAQTKCHSWYIPNADNNSNNCINDPLLKFSGGLYNKRFFTSSWPFIDWYTGNRTRPIIIITFVLHACLPVDRDLLECISRLSHLAGRYNLPLFQCTRAATAESETILLHFSDSPYHWSANHGTLFPFWTVIRMIIIAWSVNTRNFPLFY